MAIGLFGSKKKPMFGNPMERYGAPQATPGIGDGMTQPTPMMSAVRAPAQEQQRKPGLGTRLFGQGWEDKAFALGGIMQGDPSGVYMMRQDERAQQEAAQAARMAELKRAQELADFEAKEGIKAKYETRKPTSLQQNYEWLLENQPDAAASYLERMTDNSEYRVGPDGRFYRVDKGVPTAPVGKLTPISGGPTASQSGGF